MMKASSPGRKLRAISRIASRIGSRFLPFSSSVCIRIPRETSPVGALMLGLLTIGGGVTAGLRSGSGAVVGPVGVLEVIGGRNTRLGWSDSGKLFALPGIAGGL